MYKRVNTSDPERYDCQDNQIISSNDEKQKNGHRTSVAEKEKKDVSEAEAQSEHVPYPKSVFFIISNEFCERFSYYGMRTILSLYLKNVLLYSESDSTIIYHIFVVFSYFFPLIGAIISDSWLGKFRTILYVSILYACGNILLAVTSVGPLNIPQAPFTILALFMIAIGTGGIKPCVSSFGGDQFVLPQQAAQLAAFFSVFYFSINAGSLISTFLTPILREDVHCFGEDSCYPLAFAVPGILMIVSVVIFFMGSPLYKIKNPEGNVMIEVVKCISHGAKKKFQSKEKREHWLDHADPKYERSLIEDIKTMLKVLVVFIPLPIFFACYDQQGSTWTFQAARMDGRLGSFTLLPDQMQVINPLLILAFIPLFTYGIYPFLGKYNILTSSLRRMILGGLLCALAFGISAGVSFALEATYPELPTAGQAQIRIYNPFECDAKLTIDNLSITQTIPSMGYKHIDVDITGSRNVSYNWEAKCGLTSYSNSLSIAEETGYVYFSTKEKFWFFEDDINKPEDGLPKIRTIVNNRVDGVDIIYHDGDDVALSVPSSNNNFTSIDPGTYKLGTVDVKFDLGGVYTVLVQLAGDNKIEKVATFEITQANSVHILWQIPQYVVITAGEILFSITGLEFSYSNAPPSMKSVLTAAFLLTSAVGDVIIIIIESAKIFDRQSYDFLLYTGLMVVDMILFAFLARTFPNEKRQSEEEKEADKLEGDKEAEPAKTKELESKTQQEDDDHL